MSMNTRRFVAACCLGVPLVGVGTWAYAQAWGARPVTPTVISGSDIGFRIEATRGDTPIGSLVIRVNGEWIEPDFGSGVRRLEVK